MIGKFWNWLWSVPQKKVVVQPITPEDMRQNKLIQQLQLQKQGLEAELAKNQAEKRIEEEEEKKKNVEDELKGKLQEQKQELKNRKFKHTVSLRKLFVILEKNKRLGDAIEITDKDDKKIFGIFEDIVLIDDGKTVYMAITNREGNIICMGRKPTDIIYKPASLNQLPKRLRIAVPLDEHGQRIQDLEEIFVPDLIRDDNNKAYIPTKEFNQPIVQALAKREDIIRDQKDEIERYERLLISLQAELDNIKMANISYKNQVDVMRSELSQAMNVSLEFTNKTGDMHRRLMTLQEYNLMYETMTSGLKKVNEELVKANEEMGSKTEFRKALLLNQELLRFAKDFVPRVIHEHHEAEPQKIAPVQPGEVIK